MTQWINKHGEKIVTIIFVISIIVLSMLFFPCDNTTITKTRETTIQDTTIQQNKIDTLNTENIFFEYPTIFYAIP